MSGMVRSRHGAGPTHMSALVQIVLQNSGLFRGGPRFKLSGAGVSVVAPFVYECSSCFGQGRWGAAEELSEPSQVLSDCRQQHFILDALQTS